MTHHTPTQDLFFCKYGVFGGLICQSKYNGDFMGKYCVICEVRRQNEHDSPNPMHLIRQNLFGGKYGVNYTRNYFTFLYNSD